MHQLLGVVVELLKVGEEEVVHWMMEVVEVEVHLTMVEEEVVLPQILVVGEVRLLNRITMNNEENGGGKLENIFLNREKGEEKRTRSIRIQTER